MVVDQHNIVGVIVLDVLQESISVDIWKEFKKEVLVKVIHNV